MSCKSSRPAWGAWIEMMIQLALSLKSFPSRPAWGAWIEILLSATLNSQSLSRAPHGARGLKLLCYQQWRRRLSVAPRMGRVD